MQGWEKGSFFVHNVHNENSVHNENNSTSCYQFPVLFSMYTTSQFVINAINRIH